MGFIYSFVVLDEAQLQHRRQLLDFYASTAQFSALIPLLAIYISKSLPFLLKGFSRSSSPHRPKERQSPKPSKIVKPRASLWTIRWRRLSWYLDGDIFDGRDGWGTKREWFVAGVWMLWLLMLAFASTGDGTLKLSTMELSMSGPTTISLILLLLFSLLLQCMHDHDIFRCWNSY